MEFWKEIELKHERRELLRWFARNKCGRTQDERSLYKANALRFKRINQALNK